MRGTLQTVYPFWATHEFAIRHPDGFYSRFTGRLGVMVDCGDQVKVPIEDVTVIEIGNFLTMNAADEWPAESI